MTLREKAQISTKIEKQREREKWEREDARPRKRE